jgi:hypothetical protein
MWTKASVAGGVAAVLLVAGGAGAAIAYAQGTAAPGVATVTPSGGPTSSPTAAGADHRGGAKHLFGRLKTFQHAEWVTKGDGDTFVTHEAILGQVTAVSSTSISVKSADGTSLTFAVTADTKVHQRKPKGSASAPTPTMADVKSGQTVLVSGVKSPDLTARHIGIRAS